MTIMIINVIYKGGFAIIDSLELTLQALTHLTDATGMDL